MGEAKFQRQHLRAKLSSDALYVDDENVFKAKTINISEGGVLLSELPHVPEINSLPVAIKLIEYPKFSSLSYDQILNLNIDDFDNTIIKTKLRMVRSFSNQSNVDKVFVNFIGCEFYNPSNDVKVLINQYVEVYAKNTVYLLNLFEALRTKADLIDVLRHVAFLMGYDRRMKVPLLRAKVLHDYQSLENL